MARRFKRKYGVTPLERILIILLIAVVVGATLGVILPRINNGIAEITGRYTATGTAAETLNKLAVVDRPNGDGYDRDLFGFRETDDDGNGCDVREDILARDLTDVAYVTRNGCKVKSGVLNLSLIHIFQGPSGRGKSTLLKLLMRYWDPQQGTCLLYTSRCV